MAPKSKLFKIQSGLFLYEQPEQIFFFFLSLLGSTWHLSTVATYCLGSFGCCSSRHNDYFRLCCHGDDCRSCLYAGDSCPSCAADDDGGWNRVRRRSADFCQRGMLGAGRGRYYAAWSPLAQISHLLPTSAEGRSRCLTAGAAACGAAACSSGEEGEENMTGAVAVFSSNTLGHLRQRASAGYQETSGTSGLGVEECRVEN